MLKFFVLLLLLAQLTFSSLAFSDFTAMERLLGLPERSKDALSGSEFIQKIKNTPERFREKMVVDEVLSGNIPDFQRRLVPIERVIQSGAFRGKTMRYWVLPDYLAVGSNEDFVRVPLNLSSIKILLQKLNLSIPTTVMVNDIYQQAQVKLYPAPLPSSREMSSVQYIQRHHQLVQSQLKKTEWKPGMLVAGHKKDVVQSLRLLTKPQAVAIYGWHTTDKDPIQPLSTVHGIEYADYSHGVRFVSNIVEVNNKVVDLRDVLSQKLSETMASDHRGSKPRS